MKHLTVCLAWALLLAGCANVQQSRPLQADLAGKGLQLTRALPSPLPAGSAAIPGTQYIIVSAGSTVAQLVDMLNPIPFVGGLAEDEMRKRQASGYRSHYAQVDPFAIATAQLAGSPLLSGQSGALPLKPLVYIMEGSDARWRLSLVFRVEAPNWVGRFMYHLPTTYSSEEMASASSSTVDTLRQEIAAGSDVLRQLMERDARGELKGSGTQAEFGSLYIIGRDLAGVVSASRLPFGKAEIIEEGPDYMVLRASGDLHADAATGALAYGVHYFRREQLNEFRKKP
ncbi:hypothetical protein [Roseateles amylovorans]|uniref:Lipoprotein n=1 Tax=Roseateles amylovorans TaxID=2978473 RepID=A0ABY6B5T2_9BURK|nr:hypothetical protein [Roseateles amylovorans]UXH80111.1 hypothetical protein N4261_09600 [Roseateles amylovorans]